MDGRSGIRLSPRVFLGGAIVVIGVLAALDALDVVGFGSVIRFWPLVLIAFGLINLIGATVRSQRVWGVILLALGSVILLNNVDAFDLSGSLIAALVIILLGLLILSRGFGRRPSGTVAGTWMHEWAFFGGGERRYSSKEFRGGEANAVFGGLDIDLREVAFAEESAVLDCFVMFGGIDFKVPPGWRIEMQAFALFGGASDSTHHAGDTPGDDAPRRLIVRGAVLFGGLEVKD